MRYETKEENVVLVGVGMNRWVYRVNVNAGHMCGAPPAPLVNMEASGP
jgi:hypothetical protein